MVFSGEDGIRTHAPVKTNGFQDRPVMTTSVPLHIPHILCFSLSLFAVPHRRLCYNITQCIVCQHIFKTFFAIFLISSAKPLIYCIFNHFILLHFFCRTVFIFYFQNDIYLFLFGFKHKISE